MAETTEKNYSLVNCLQLFNRKERYWLLRNALGSGKKKLDLPLGSDFFTTVRAFANFPPNVGARDVWWAMDYHFDWIARAIALYSRFADPSRSKQGNPLRFKLEGSPLITGTQEDVDLILACENAILLIEAKFDTPWNQDQIKEKQDRIELLVDYLKELNIDPPITIEKLFMSAREPKSKVDHSRFAPLDFPEKYPSPDQFFINTKGRFCKTTRRNPQTDNGANETGTPKMTYTQWEIVGAFDPEG